MPIAQAHAEVQTANHTHPQPRQLRQTRESKGQEFKAKAIESEVRKHQFKKGF